MKLIGFIFLLVLFPYKSDALVDYSEETSSAPRRSFTASPPPSAPAANASRTSGPSNYSTSTNSGGNAHGPMIFAFSPRYEVITVKKSQRESKVKATGLEARVNSPWNFHLDLKYSMYSTTDKEISEEGSSQKGNPEFKIGIDWLDFGSAQDRTTLTLLAGASLAAKDSTLGSSRTDKIIGLETAKRFFWAGLGLGYELFLVGTPDQEQEAAIGNIHHIYAGLDFDLSPDIGLGIMADNYSIGNSSDTSRVNYLREKLSFSSVAASLTLKPQGLCAIELGARFNTKRVQSPESLVSARLWNLPGAYGNTIYTGLGVGF